MKTQNKHIIILLTLLLCLLGTGAEAWASTVTLKTTTGGQFRYRVETGVGTGSYGSWSSYVTANTNVTVADGRRINIQAIPKNTTSTTYYFVNWTGYATVNYFEATITINEARTYTANFTTEYKTVKLNINSADYGTAQIYGPFANQNVTSTTQTSVKVGVGATVRLTASPAADHYFTKWTGTATNTLYRFTFTVSANVNYQANFTAYGYTLKVKPNNTSYGNVKVEGPFAAVTGTNGETIEKIVGKGATVKVTATQSQSTGYGFKNWTSTSGGPDTSTDNPFTFTMPEANITVTANYSDTWEGPLVAGKTYTVTSESSTVFKVSCSGTPHHNQTYKYIGKIVASSGTVIVSFKNSSTLWVKGRITVEGTGTLKLNATSGNRTLKRAVDLDYMLYNGAATSTLIVNETNAYNLTLDGGAVYATAGDARTEWDGSSPRGCVVYVMGNFQMYKSVVQNSCRYIHGAAFYVNSPNDNVIYQMYMKDVVIQGCQAASIFDVIGLDRHKVEMYNVKFTKNMQIAGTHQGTTLPNDANGIYRTHGNSKGTLLMDGCELCYNKAEASGGAIYWNATGIPATETNGTKFVLQNGTKIHHNEAVLKAGAIYLSGTGEISDCEIYNNVSGYQGAGIYVEPNGGGHADYPGTAPSLVLKSGTKIYSNTSSSSYGGGVYFSITPHNDVGWDASNNPISPEFKMQVQDGVHIYGNKALRGAGICIYDNAANKHKNSSFNTWSGVYRRNVVISGGTVYNNETTGSNTLGAGVYIEKAVNGSILDGSAGYTYTDSNLPDANTNTGAAGTMNVEISGGYVYKNYAKSGSGGGIYLTDGVNASYPAYGSVCKCTVKGTAKVYGNQADANGGGIYVNSGNFIMQAGNVGCDTFDFTDAAGTTTTGVSGVNEAKAGNGGGVYVAGGNFSMTGGYVDYNKATKSGNTGGDGGGFYVTGTNSSVDVSGGYIRYNKATSGRGGGFYVNTAANTETKIRYKAQVTNNEAQNGGGAYIAQGKLTVDGSASGSTVKVNSNTASSNGGGVYVNTGTVAVTSATLGSNKAVNGGGIFANGGSVTLKGATLSSNQATSGNGGGVWAKSTVNVFSSTLSGNTAQNGTNGKGGGIYAEGNSTKVTITRTNASSDNSVLTGNKARLGGAVYAAAQLVTVKYATIGNTGTNNANTASDCGGGIYAAGSVTLRTGATIQCNTATNNGGGVYVDNGTFTMTAGTIGGTSSSYANKATSGSGGGVYVTGSSASVTVGHADSTTVIRYNTASVSGGGIYAGQGTVGLTKTTLSNNTATNGNGGGIYAAGQVTVTGGTISSNQANKNAANCGLGGGIYADAGSGTNITIQSSSTISSNIAKDGAGIYAKSGNISLLTSSKVFSNVAANNGGGLYSQGGTTTINCTSAGHIGASGQANTAKYGGGIYAAGGTVNLTSGYLQYNTASQDGGGIYADGGTVNVNYAAEANGTVRYNSASVRGGGLFISESGKLTLKGITKLTRNHVPTGKKGGGVYLAGVVEVGDASKAASTITVQENYAGDDYQYGSGSNNRNNIYLPEPEAIPYTSSEPHVDVITVIENGLTTSSRVGFSVPHNFVPVIYCDYSSTSRAYLDTYLINGTMEGVVFEDSERYSTMHSLVSPYDPDHIYLSNLTWVQHVTSQPASGFAVDGSGNVTISSKEGLAWLISYVNGLNDVTGGAHNMSGKTVTLTADVDMDEYSWVPIGFSAQPFNGTFNGNGHMVSGINCIFLGESGVTQTGLDLGMFGNVGGNASISNVYLENAYYSSMSVTDKTFVIGGVAAKLNSSTASVTNSGAQAEIESVSPTSILGGLVGQVTSGTVHSSYALSTLKGYQMGGLVGSNAGDLYNSFANASFTYKGSGYVGGLVGVNSGTVENCYMRLLSAAPASNFGYLVGDNTSGTIKYSYSPVATYTVSGKEGARTGLGTYTATTADAYDYKVHDNQVSASNSFVPTGGNKQLVTTLNKWVKQDATHETNYTKWLRTTTQVINGDYPLLRMPANNAVSATNGDAFLYYGDINTHLTTYKAANQAICLYGNRENVNTNIGIGTSAPLYIDQDAVITQTGNIQAYVGVTLDNSAGSNGANPSFGGEDAIDWHFFSSALSNAPIGLVYGDQSPYNLGVYPSWEAYFNDANGYFPTNLDDYYDEWDLYAYYEPDYHWINLKRNSASHWHEDYPDIHIYPYTNDTEFVPGRGYMVALAEDNYLQAYGTLNNNSSNFTTVPVTYTSSICWTTRDGHNLLGNPYQSYLDFEAFAEDANNATLWHDRRPFYIIIDEDKKDYVLYTVGQSPNPLQASRFLHPHQGFMIDVDQSGNARFSNDMRTITTTVTASGSTVEWSGDFRGSNDAPCYPLVNLLATDVNGNRDIVTVELGRPDKGGALKQDAMRTGKGSLWCHYEDKDYALVFTQPGLDYANIRFASDEDTEFTMTWSTHNGVFSYLHLIDNMTGADIDCLQETEYTFTAKTTDYVSRFRLVFDYTGIEENGEDGLSMGSETFAYFANGEIHLTDASDEASLQIVDMLGRVIFSKDGVHTVSTSGMTPGVYVLRLTTANGTRTQKIVLN